MPVLAALFLVAHGLVHLAIWLPPPAEGAPFDPGHSWLLHDVRAPARALAIVAGAAFALAGILGLTDAGGAEALAITGSGLSLLLVAITFNPWLLGAVAIDIAIAAVAMG